MGMLYQDGQEDGCGQNKGPSLDGVFSEGCFTKFSEVFTDNLNIVGGELQMTTFISMSTMFFTQPSLSGSPWLSWPSASWPTAWASGWGIRDSLSRTRTELRSD